MRSRDWLIGSGCVLLLWTAGCGPSPDTELAEARAKVRYFARWSGGRVEPDLKKGDEPIIGIDFSRTQILDAALFYVGKLESLRTLSLAKCMRITDVGVTYLGELPDLQTLDLSDNPWTTDQGVKRLTKLRTLRSLNLAGNKGVTDWCLEYVKELSQLQRLDLRNTSVSERGVQMMKAWDPRMEVLHGKSAAGD